MKEWLKKSRYVRLGVTLFVTAAAVMLFVQIISDLGAVGRLLTRLLGVLMPFIVGLVLAYVLSPVYDATFRISHRLFEKMRMPQKVTAASAKAAASVAAVAVIVLTVGGLISLVIPQLYASVMRLIETFPQKQASFEAWLSQTGGLFGETVNDVLVEVFRTVSDGANRWASEVLVPNLASLAVQGVGYVASVVGAVINMLVGVIICVYVLNSKSLFAAQAKKTVYAVCGVSAANTVLSMTRYIDRTFGRFINGMLLDALMVGVACFAGMSLLRIPYALLVSTVVGVFNLVPVFGPIVAAVIGAVFVFLDSPFKAAVFLVFVLILQQIDGNVIAPRILGGQTGLSSFWVIFAIVAGGGLFGFVGMLIGVPAFAVIYTLFKQWVADRLRRRRIPAHTAAYDDLCQVDERSLEFRYDLPDTGF